MALKYSSLGLHTHDNKVRTVDRSELQIPPFERINDSLYLAEWRRLKEAK